MVKAGTMQTARKITVEVPEELLEKAQKASGEGITQTVRTGLQLLRRREPTLAYGSFAARFDLRAPGPN
jgi:hypothetical protein